MKKLMITLGFAAATIMAANAQEVPAAEEQPQTTVQTQPNTQDETLNTDTQPMDDRAVDGAYDQTTETVRDEINQTPTEPMQENAVDEAPLQEEPIESTGTYEQPSTTTSPVDVDDDYSVEEPIDEMQEDVSEMQGEDPNAQSSMQDIPSGTADDQSYQNAEGQNDAPITTDTESANQDYDKVDQPTQDQPQNNSSAMNESSDKEVVSISESELPEEVSQAFQDSEYANGSIENVYVLDKAAVDKLMQNNAEQMYIGDQNPDKIYQLQVKSDDAQNILYYDETGELIGSASI